MNGLTLPNITMTRRFLEFIPFVFKWEGGYDNDPDDPGGETKYGIDKRSHPGEDIRNLTKERATEIYWQCYWVANRCEAQPVGLGEAFFNACVNCGPGRAARLLAACGGSARVFIDKQEAFYRQLAEARPVLGKYLNGWLNRTADLRRQLRIG